MKREVLVFISWCLLVAPVFAEDPVYFRDPILKAAVEDALWISDPTPTDMLLLTSLTAGSSGIQDIAGLEYATNLASLQLPCNRISSITAVSGLVNLRRVVLNNNSIGNITPLANSTYLEHLDMHDNYRISNLAPLSGRTHLKTLILRGNKISNIEPLAGLSELETLRLEYNEISNIAPLAALTALTRLDLRGNPLNDDAHDICIPQIFANNPGINLTYPASPSHFMISSTAGGSIIEPGEGEFLLTETSHIFIEAKADPCFVFVGFSGNLCTTQNPVQISVDQDYQIRANFISVLDTLYVDDDAPNDSGPNDIEVSDLREDGTPAHPFDSIQEAIEVGAEGASIIVRPGTYGENISLMGKRIHVMGMDPNALNGNGYPIIDGAGNGPTVSFTQGEDPNCILVGFILSGGREQSAAAVLCVDSSPTIANCLIVGNHTTQAEGAVVHCRNSQATLINCTIADNDPGERGTGLRLVDSNVVLLNCILWENGPSEIALSGTSEPAISYSNVAGGWPSLGNLDADPLFVRGGYWADPENPNLVLEPSHPKAVWIAGDYHLRSQAGRWEPQTQTWIQDEVTSPCINAGDPLATIGEEPDPNGGVINMGAYGGTAQAGKSN